MAAKYMKTAFPSPLRQSSADCHRAELMVEVNHSFLNMFLYTCLDARYFRPMKMRGCSYCLGSACLHGCHGDPTSSPEAIATRMCLNQFLNVAAPFLHLCLRKKKSILGNRINAIKCSCFIQKNYITSRVCYNSISLSYVMPEGKAWAKQFCL